MRTWYPPRQPPLRSATAFAPLLIDSGANGDSGRHGPLENPETYDVHGHLLPGSRDEVRERMDAYLRRT